MGKVISCIQHPNADRLKVTTVDIGTGELLQIVCGAPNVAVGQTVPVATIGTMLYDKNGLGFIINKGKIVVEDTPERLQAGLAGGHARRRGERAIGW